MRWISPTKATAVDLLTALVSQSYLAGQMLIILPVVNSFTHS
jgi:hypothetical protein